MPDSPDGHVRQTFTLSTQSDELDPGTPIRFPCLTLAYHPDWSRVGERSFIGHLVATPIDVSRTEPSFGHRAEGHRAPLADPYMSREPIRLTWQGAEGVLLSLPSGYRKLLVNGAPATSTMLVSPDELAAGVVMEFAKRIVLVLHLATQRDPPPALGMVGQSDAIDEVRLAISRVADLTVPVLIRGETGVGKEHVARAIHDASPCATAPWVAINMAAVSPTTAASELFGHAKGAFTGASARRKGMFERASNGTLFLDEVGETPDHIQPMLLRVLETGEIQAVGDSGTTSVCARVVSATDADLESAQHGRSFRPALFHRLAGYQIHVPPLRARREDIGPLLVHFLSQELETVGDAERVSSGTFGKRPWFPQQLAARLIRFCWPGNVRQLRNVVRQIVISSRGAQEASFDAQVEALIGGGSSRPPDRSDAEAAPAAPSPTSPDRRGRKSADISDSELFDALLQNDWAVGPTAKVLGIPRSSLYGIMRKHPDIRAAKDILESELRVALEACGGDLDDLVRNLRVSKRGLLLRLRELGLEPG